ncbi:MAG: ATP-binding protein [Candidatus Latescibacterota bacterium]
MDLKRLRRLLDHRVLVKILLYGVVLVPLARYTPLYVFIPLAAVVILLHTLVESRMRWRRYRAVLDAMQQTQSNLLPDIAQIKDRDPDKIVYKFFKELVSELERKNFQLVEKNIQLLSIKEIGQTLVSSLDESKVVDAVINFLSKGLGYRELFVGIFQEERNAFNVYTFRDTAGGNTYEESVLPLEKVDGLLKKAVMMHQSLLIRDPEMHRLGTLNGKPMFPESTMNSYVIVPLVKSNATQDCGLNNDCLLNMNQVQKEKSSMAAEFKCPGCGRIPVLGVLGVTDGFKAASLSKVDLVSVETLAVQLSTMLENTSLFQELKQEELFRENVINSMMNGLVTVDVEGRIKLANETAVNLTGYSPEELSKMTVGELISDKISEAGGDPVLRTLQTGRGLYQGEAWLNKKDGQTHPIILNTTFLQDESRRVQGALAIFIDITRIKRMEEQIQHLDKLAALGRLSSSIAHEIRNPLTGIASGIQYLKRGGAIAESELDNINFILDEVNRIDRLIGDLMNVVRIGDLIYEETSIEAIVKNCIAGMQELAKQRSVTVKTEFPEQSKKVSVDADRVTQVMINLLKNAIEASHERGQVTVSISFPEDVKDVLFDAVRDFVIIAVKDNGLGLTEEEKTRIFEPFYSKKPTGTGLGLYVTHSIVERHGGYIYVNSEYGAGTVFTVYLPITQVEHGDTNEVGHSVGG